MVKVAIADDNEKMLGILGNVLGEEKEGLGRWSVRLE